MKQDISKDYIKVIAEKRSISLAADQLGITQPALSAHLKKTENRLGVKLFDRTVLPIRLTEAGRAYISYIDGVSELHDKFMDCIEETKKENKL